ncbi:MAG: hypothetical protein QF486_03085 [Candidatus Woesearchaeota archaeon]|jgi:hypothetical protein|nr:hypothetical protein [Candidatus Woesearchaeota archaeon]MDP7181539.1 hypothetical protein [Candidatus Woesearchaeota archaeon]MDP7198581.1 hypothetical protein [Candidatus Woesearchaeota archaeon]MDP7466677.1 hypothetical protein [Candidatus Woesearchaeota archaeon]MDP7647220.1 hypothetical protein [Candidatus Woesearchaeota archaeon]|tara:strand:+ start:84 stop:479 length:396 start_codon:yes stop_codon:yes gene_type:complete
MSDQATWDFYKAGKPIQTGFHKILEMVHGCGVGFGTYQKQAGGDTTVTVDGMRTSIDRASEVLDALPPLDTQSGKLVQPALTLQAGIGAIKAAVHEEPPGVKGLEDRFKDTTHAIGQCLVLSDIATQYAAF